MNKKSIILTMAFLMLNSNLAMSAVVSKKDLEDVQRQVQRQNIEHKRLQAEATKISLELAEISKQMIKKAKQIQDTEELLSNLEKELLKLQNDLKNAEDEFKIEDENLIKTLYALQNLAMKPTESLFVQPLTPVEIIRSAMLLRETVPFLSEEAAQIRHKLDTITQNKEKIEKQVAKIFASKSKLETEHQKMKSLIDKKTKMRSQIESKSAAAKQKIKELAEQAKDIKELLEKLERERIAREKIERERREKERREREIIERARAERDQKAREAYEREKAEREREEAQAVQAEAKRARDIGALFKKAKGKLPMPARGDIIVGYGQETTKGVTSKGITIKTRPEAQVISPFDGSVIFAGPFRGYGKIIIIEHGGGYMSLLAGLDEIDCEVGQMLLAGEPVGQMPQDEDAKLYVELRDDGKTIDPTAWIAK